MDNHWQTYTSFHKTAEAPWSVDTETIRIRMTAAVLINEMWRQLVIVHCSLLLNTEPNAGDRHFMGLLMTNTWQIYNNWHWSWKKASVSTLNTHLKLGVIVYSMNNTIGGDPKWVPNTPHNTSRSHSTRGGGVLSGPCFVGTIRAYTQQILADSTYQGFHVELKGDGQHGQVWCSSHLA